MHFVRNPVELGQFNAILLLLGIALAWRGVMEIRRSPEPAHGSGLVVVLVDGSGHTAQTEFLQRKYGLPAIIPGDLISHQRLRKLCAQGGFVVDRYPNTPEQGGQLSAALKQLQVKAPVFVQLESSNETTSSALYQRLDAISRDYPEAITWIVAGPQPIQDLPAAIQSIFE